MTQVGMSLECEVQISWVCKLEVSGTWSFLMRLFNYILSSKQFSTITSSQGNGLNFVQIVDKVMKILQALYSVQIVPLLSFFISFPPNGSQKNFSADYISCSTDVKNNYFYVHCISFLYIWLLCFSLNYVLCSCKKRKFIIYLNKLYLF